MKRFVPVALTATVLLGGCASSGGTDESDAPASEGERTVTLVTHESFNMSDEVKAQFEESTGYTLEVVAGGDAVELVNKAILTAGDPEGDVLFGIDDNLLTRAYDEDLFDPYEADDLDALDEAVLLDAEHRVTPIDRGDVCLNYDKEYFATAGVEPPDELIDLVAPQYKDLTVVQDPATSTPGLAFMLATITRFGDQSYDGGWQGYWEDLKANGVSVASGWEDAYYGQFSGGSGEGDRPIVVSYASSPPVEVMFADPKPAEAPTGVVEKSCFRQIEFAGILTGAANPEGAKALIDFMIGKSFQEDIPSTMYVYPVRTDAELPEEFVKFSVVPAKSMTQPADRVAAYRDEWVQEWTDLMEG